MTLSVPTGPVAYVPVIESPYVMFTEVPAGANDDMEYAVDVDCVHTVVLHASDMTQRSLDPVSST